MAWQQGPFRFMTFKEWGEGRPVTVDFINELIKGYSERHSSTPHGRIPTNMLWSDTEVLPTPKNADTSVGVKNSFSE